MSLSHRTAPTSSTPSAPSATASAHIATPSAIHTASPSLPLQISLYFDESYCFLFFAISIITFVYKAIALPYPTSLLAWETTGLSLLAVITAIRIAVGNKGNAIQQTSPLIMFTTLCITVIVGHVFYVAYQTYVLRIDQIANAIALIFVTSQTLMAIMQIIIIQTRPVH